MKTILLFLFISFRLYSQDCSVDIDRAASYELIEIYNPDNEKYDNYTQKAVAHLTVVVSAENKLITFSDKVDKLQKRFTIRNCTTLEDSIIYNCTDQSNGARVRLVFTNDKDFFILNVRYLEPLVYRVKRLKIKKS